MPTDPMFQRRHITVQRQSTSGTWVDVGYILIPEAEMPGGFRYADSYTGPPLAPDLDYRFHGEEGSDSRFFPIAPDNLFHARNVDRQDLHPVFQEALPGRWGEQVMVSHVPSYGRASPAEKLWMLGDRRAAALRFEPGGGVDAERWIEGDAALRAIRREVQVFVDKITSRIRPGPLGGKNQRWALASNGGQTPKCAFTKDGVEYVAKFDMGFVGAYETSKVERGMLHLSEQAGLDTAATYLFDQDAPDTILLSRRFDVDSEGHRIHKINGATALDAPIHARKDYVDLANFLKAHSTDAESDLRELFGRMILNVLANNTDDHLGQFEFLADGDGWRLAPNFDVLVDELDEAGQRRPHALRIAGDDVPDPLTMDWLDRVADRFGISEEEARETAVRVVQAMGRFEPVMLSWGVSETTVRRYLAPAIRTSIEGLHTAMQQRHRGPGIG